MMLNSQSDTFAMSMNWPSQNSAPFGSEHFAMQPPMSWDSQLLAHVPLQSKFASAVQRPWQDESHLALQSADGGVPTQDPWQLD